MPKTLPVLLVDDEKSILFACRMALANGGIRNIVTCGDSREVMDLLKERTWGMVMLDLTMPFISGGDLLPQIREEYPELPVTILTGLNDVQTAVRCMKAGAFDYMVKPVEESRLVSGVLRALQFRELQLENSALRTRLQTTLEHPDAFRSFVTDDKTMYAIFGYIETVAVTGKPVLVTGETGTGKEVIARILHEVSGRAGAFVAVNAAGLDDNVFSDTLFGHVRGAFTGADGMRRGLIQGAEDGTLFLDEIGDLTLQSQVKLLRLLQEHAYFPLGADEPVTTDARIILATNRDLKAMVASGDFRKDLYYRLCTHHVHVPPLRARSDDLPLLVEHLLAKAAAQLGKKKPTPPPQLFTLLNTWHFPGNVRELEAMVFEAVSHHRGGVLSMERFRLHMGTEAKEGFAEEKGDGEAPLAIGGRFPTLREAADFLVQEALSRTGGNQTAAARLLGISRPALSKRLRRREEDGES
jgi:DNA-binding NtrC family response regulator